MCFAVVILLEIAEWMSWCRVSRLTTIAMQRKGEKKNYNLYRGYKLFLSENCFEVMRVDYGIASISLFRIYVLPSSMSI